MLYDFFFISENKKNFSVCSKNDMIAKLEELPVDNDDCFRDVAYDKSFSDLQISLCGNGEVEVGEDCDCGMNILDILDKEIRGTFCFANTLGLLILAL
jgi:hypothetical protein